ncbi:MAG: hypothetical protein IPG87_15980 [Saprospiraceae bacterium]|nr:hypothetical protein [Candidatus Vicinibacter affinis]
MKNILKLIFLLLSPLCVQSQSDTMGGKAVHTFNSVNNSNIQTGPIGAIYDTRNFGLISPGSDWSTIGSFYSLQLV